jgi:hypothetical protein
MRRASVLIAATLTLAGATETRAGMGLTCAQWLDARAYVRFDTQTGKFVDARPNTVAPASKEVDVKVSEAIYYVTGHLETLMALDHWLAKLASPPGIQMPTELTIPTELAAVDSACRGGPQDDVLDVISAQNQSTVLLRINAIDDMVSAYMKRGREQGSATDR